MQSPDQIRQHLNAAIQGMNAAELAPLAGRLIAETIEATNMNKDASPSKQAKPRDQALDLVLMIYPRELDKAAVRSLLAESLAACDARQLAALDEPLELLRKAHPDDLSVAIATALRALAGDDPKRIESALERLLQLLDKTPLEPLPSGTRPNARQRAHGRAVDPLVGRRTRLLEAAERDDARARRSARRPGPRCRQPPERQPLDAGHAP